ncbi:MAG: sensor domain-containing diguanylate cyclase [Mesorhizobium sp.]|nr:sensor domain-containing diguanylate cyclase [Mesorhizobium sp.]
MPDELSAQDDQPSAPKSQDGKTIAALRAALDAQGQLIRQQSADLAHSQKIFDRSSAAARIGVWECELTDESLRWTDVVYDIFDMPRGSTLDRNEIVKLYSKETVEHLHRRRSRAIAERTGFSLDAEIITQKGNRRWIRITATVECDKGAPVRIFGMKQDITQEKILADRTRYLAEFDEMTGLANRSQFHSKLAELAVRETERPTLGALLLVDLDGFKIVNDSFGHAAGDDCLREAATRMLGVCTGAELVARIGGDEFAILVGSHLDLGAISALAREIIAAVGAPLSRGGRMLKLGASVGAAQFDTCTPAQLFTRADTALYAAKAAGRSTFRIFKPGHDDRNAVAAA